MRIAYQCGFCGRVGAEAGVYRDGVYVPLCHPNDNDLQDCYHHVTVRLEEPVDGWWHERGIEA